MKRTRWIAGAVALSTVWAAFVGVRAADPPEGDVPGRPERGELRERLKNLTPEERQEKLKELREKRGALPDGPLREELQKFRDEIKNLPPEERDARIKEFREKHPNLQAGPGVNGRPDRAEIEKFRDEIKGLPPAERDAKMKEWRAKNRGALPALRDLPPEERQAKRQEIKARMQKRLEEFRKKKADGTITEQESRQLERMEEMTKRFEQAGGKPAVRRPPPAK